MYAIVRIMTFYKSEASNINHKYTHTTFKEVFSQGTETVAKGLLVANDIKHHKTHCVKLATTLPFGDCLAHGKM